MRLLVFSFEPRSHDELTVSEEKVGVELISNIFVITEFFSARQQNPWVNSGAGKAPST